MIKIRLGKMKSLEVCRPQNGLNTTEEPSGFTNLKVKFGQVRSLRGVCSLHGQSREPMELKTTKRVFPRWFSVPCHACPEFFFLGWIPLPALAIMNAGAAETAAGV